MSAGLATDSGEYLCTNSLRALIVAGWIPEKLK